MLKSSEFLTDAELTTFIIKHEKVTRLDLIKKILNDKLKRAQDTPAVVEKIQAELKQVLAYEQEVLNDKVYQDYINKFIQHQAIIYSAIRESDEDIDVTHKVYIKKLKAIDDAILHREFKGKHSYTIGLKDALSSNEASLQLQLPTHIQKMMQKNSKTRRQKKSKFQKKMQAKRTRAATKFTPASKLIDTKLNSLQVAATQILNAAFYYQHTRNIFLNNLKNIIDSLDKLQLQQLNAINPIVLANLAVLCPEVPADLDLVLASNTKIFNQKFNKSLLLDMSKVQEQLPTIVTDAIQHPKHPNTGTLPQLSAIVNSIYSAIKNLVSKEHNAKSRVTRALALNEKLAAKPHSAFRRKIR